MGFVISVLTIIGTIFGGMLWFHSQSKEDIDELKSKLEELDALVHRIDKDMVKISDDRVQALLAGVERRVDDVDKKNKHRFQTVQSEIAKVQVDVRETKALIGPVLMDQKSSVSVVDNRGKYIGEIYPGSQEGRISYLLEESEKNKRHILSLKKVVTSHQILLAQLKAKIGAKYKSDSDS